MAELIDWLSDIIKDHLGGIIQGILLASIIGIACDMINNWVGFANPNFNPLDATSFTKSVNAILNVWDKVGIWTGAITAIPALGKWFLDWLDRQMHGSPRRRR